MRQVELKCPPLFPGTSCFALAPRPTHPPLSSQSAGATSAKTFDLAVRMRSGQDYLFRGIPR